MKIIAVVELFVRILYQKKYIYETMKFGIS